MLLALVVALLGAGLPAAAALRLAFGSCNKQDRDQGYWNTIRDRAPDIWLWGGDIIYGDKMGLFRPPQSSAIGEDLVKGSTYSCLLGLICFAAGTPSHLRAEYARQSSAAGYQALVSSTSKVLGIWDDHDMGLNDGDARYRWRNESKQALLDFLGEPPGSARRARAGVWDAYLAPGPPGRRVAVHLLDVRHNKDPYGDPDGDFLGEEQWAWLRKSLRDMRDEAAVNIVVSGLQVFRPWPLVGEVWQRFPVAYNRLLRTLAESGARGLVLLSGDVHMAQLNAVRCGGTVVHELTSSGLTHSLKDWFFSPRLASLALWLFPQHHLVRETFLGRNFGELDISIGEDGSPSVVLRVISLDTDATHGAVVLEHNLEQLSDGTAWEGSACEPVHGFEAPWAFWLRLSIIFCALALALAGPCWILPAIFVRLPRSGQKLHSS